MAINLRFPNAVSINRFIGGFKSTSDYTDLEDTETSDALNCIYDIDGDIKQRKGSVKLYNTRLTETSSTARVPITGHYYFEKLGTTATFNIVAVGDALYNYGTATASVIRSGMNNASSTFWNFVQIQDMRSASDDIILATNGVNPIQLWNGSGTAIALNSVISATQVPIARYILQHQNIIYAANIEDSANADASVKVARTEIGSDGAPNPHRFTESFFVGGSDRNGEINGQMVLGDSIIYYTQNSIWRFTPGLGDVNDLEMVKEDIGLFAPFSLVNAGNFHVFLSERGVFIFDGQTTTHISAKVDDIILNDTNQSSLQYSKAVFDQEKNQYKLYIPVRKFDRNTRNNVGLALDLRFSPPIWQPPIHGREVSYISSFQDSDSRYRVIYGDYEGYLYQDESGLNDGAEVGYNDNAHTATTVSSLRTVSATNLPTANDGLSGLIVHVYSGTGEGQTRVIASNTSNTISPTVSFTIAPDGTSKFTIGGIRSYWRSKDIDFGATELTKLFRQVFITLEEQGQSNLDLFYIVDFNRLNAATMATVSQLFDGFTWGTSLWGGARWGNTSNVRRRISLRNTTAQSINGTHLAVRIGKDRANETWKISKIDFITKERGRR